MVFQTTIVTRMVCATGRCRPNRGDQGTISKQRVDQEASSARSFFGVAFILALGGDFL